MYDEADENDQEDDKEYLSSIDLHRVEHNGVIE
jgi:hypothetical protein